MSPLWAVPPLAAVAALVAGAALLKELAAAARSLHDELARLRELRPVVAALQGEVDRSRAAVMRLRRR